MRLVVTANHTPFVAGGAEYHIQGVVQALRRAGHEVELLRLPFHYDEGYIERQMGFAEALEIDRLNDVTVDRVISLQFPTYGVQHPDHVIWLMHQHRVCYELFDEAKASPALKALRPEVMAFDERHLGGAVALFANSPRVAARVSEYNELTAEPLYHPPPHPERLFCADDWGYVFYPSRLEPLKRQALLIRAAARLSTPAKVVIAGAGSQRRELERLIEELGVSDRVRLMGKISEAQKLSGYAHSLAVFFGPYDEDYGYVTLEAMLAAKPVITCHDSGGPLAFIRHGENGWVTEPSEEAVAAAIDEAWRHRARTAEMGRHARQGYNRLGLDWRKVVDRLLG